ncbi:CAP domain-containing protein [Streptomyces yaanensis]|uniref:CAP domain-containing protein n=1 Tax=Streptomyces yaanensis TaxID=1142239 RepID=A0ABV7SFQ4_9ACTN|nr:CAP domain-containing protein [Streptomyces sp. CGMCC 4.7035]WNB98031.1 CAP domain-containing protein [Streptomyces sp. CGMCC 4.7035]
MGRHRRSAAGRAASGRAGGVTQKQEIPTERYGPENLYGFAAVLEAERLATRSHRKAKAATPVRTGLLGVSAAVALGTVAVATGVLPGGKQFSVSGNSGSAQAGGTTPSGFATEQGGASGPANDRGSESTSRNSDRSSAPAAVPSASASPATPTRTASPKPSPTKSATAAPPAKKAPKKPKTTPSVTVPGEASAEVQVLKLVNEERAKVGCSPLKQSSPLRKLAEAFSQDMAARNFFDHTDPSGNDPWDRAAALGIRSLGGENIARGQTTAEAVMDAWMNSPGHRANILNCDFKTLGVGVHFGSGGPWWTQDFGY